MRKRITRNRYVLFFLVFFISLGFAYLSTNLNLLGSLSYNPASFDVHFEDIVLDNSSYEGAVAPTLNQDRDTISMSFNLDKPGDKLVYYADIVNSGTIDAQLGDLNITNNLSSVNSDLLDLSIKYLDGIDVTSGDVILNNSRKTIKVIVGYSTDIDISDLPNQSVSFTVDMSPGFDQCDLSSIKSSTFIGGRHLKELMNTLSGTSTEMKYNPSFKSVSPSFLNYSLFDYKVDFMSSDDPICNFVRTDTLKNGLTNENIASTEDSDVPIYLWFEGSNESIYGSGTIYWYSEADVVYLNEYSSEAFRGYDYLINISGLSNVNTSKVIEINKLFYSCNSLNDISPLKDWDVSNVSDMDSFFLYCESLTDTSALKYWDLSSLSNLASFFSDCTSLTNLSGISNWNLSNVEIIASMFVNCNYLSDISPISGWNLSGVTDMSSMFANCYSLTNISPLSGWNVSSVVNMNDVFNNCGISSLSPLSGWNVSSVETMSWMFYGCSSITNLSGLSGWVVNNVNDMSTMFASCESLNDISQISGWTTTSLLDMESMFSGCTSLTNASPIGGWNVSSVTNMSDLFCGCSLLTNITGLSGWNVSSVENMISMFLNCSSLSDITPLQNWNVSSSTFTRFMFGHCTNLTDARCLNDWFDSFVFNYHYNMFEDTGLTSTTKPTWYTGSIN